MSKDDESQKRDDAIALKTLKALISSINSAKTQGDIAVLVSAARGLIDSYGIDNPQILSALNTATNNAEEKINIESIDRAEKERLSMMSQPQLKEVAAKAPELKPDLKSLSSVLELAKSQNKEKADNLKDTAYGEIIRALEAKEAQKIQREEAVKRVDGLHRLAAAISKAEEISPEAATQLAEEAAKFKIKLVRDEEGKFELDHKSKRALDKVAALDMEEVTRKREERKADTDKDRMSESLSFGGLSSLFGDDDFYEAPVKNIIVVKAKENSNSEQLFIKPEEPAKSTNAASKDHPQPHPPVTTHTTQIRPDPTPPVTTNGSRSLGRT